MDRVQALGIVAGHGTARYGHATGVGRAFVVLDLLDRPDCVLDEARPVLDLPHEAIGMGCVWH